MSFVPFERISSFVSPCFAIFNIDNIWVVVTLIVGITLVLARYGGAVILSDN
jgi:hypothetical protein